MKRQELIDLLDRLGACSEAREWVDATKGSASHAWSACQRPDWLLWLAGHVGVSTWLIRDIAARVVAPYAMDCAHLPDEAGQLRTMPEIVDATTAAAAARMQSAADSAASAAYTARSAAYAACSAAYAARSAVYAVYSAADAAYSAADSAAGAANSAAYAARSAARGAAYAVYSAAGAELSALVRARIPWSMITSAVKGKTE